MNDQLLIELVALQQEFKKDDIPVILGGGMSFYIRRTYLKTKPSSRYPFQMEARTTNDLDIFLNSHLIINREKVEKIKDALKTLGYAVDPQAKNFQFKKEVKIFGHPRIIKVDLLSAPPPDADLDKVSIKPPRIKPKDTEGIHAYLTKEAAGIDIGLVAFECKQFSTNPEITADDKIFIPSSYNYIILKLNAFNDRKSDGDPKSDYGRHHAYDIFATVSQMNEEDWSVAKQHYIAHKDREYLKTTIEIQKNCFSRLPDLGVIRLRENVSFKGIKEQYEPHLMTFLDDLKGLFAF